MLVSVVAAVTAGLSLAAAVVLPQQTPTLTDTRHAQFSLVSLPASQPASASDSFSMNQPPTPRKTVKPAATPARTTGLWVWTWDNAPNVVNFAHSRNVTDIFLYTHPGFTKNPGLYTKMQQFVKTVKASKTGMRVWALGGDPSWVEPGNTAGMQWLKEVASVKSWFTGIHYDVEAHLAPTLVANPTNPNPAPYYTRYTTLLSDMATLAHRKGLQVDVSLPWWYHTVTTDTGNTVTDTVMPLTDVVTVITYNDTAAGVLHDAQYASEAATSQGVPFRISAETNNVNPEWITFYGETWVTLSSVLTEAETTLKESPFYVGWAIHDYTGLTGLS